ncbi:MAG: hypothetical protein RR785_08215 [Clostridium sp.]
MGENNEKDKTSIETNDGKKEIKAEAKAEVKAEAKKVWEPWQKKKMLFWLIILICGGLAFLIYAAHDLYTDKIGEDSYWNYHLTEDKKDEERIAAISKDAVPVTCGTYVETLKEISLKNSSFRVIAKVWFKWDAKEDLDMIHNFEVYNGTMNKLEILDDKVYDGIHYQCARMDVSIFKSFWTKRFPLESHQMRFYIEPLYRVQKVKLLADSDSGINPSVGIAGYNFERYATSIFNQEYNSKYGDDTIKDDLITSEYMFQMEFNRNGFGLYLKCFIALFGTSLWVFITIFLCTYHRLDPLSMIPAALFGTVSNIMVGANLLPDALDIGLLEYVNTWGIFTILAGAIIIININRIRNKHQDHEFAGKFGRIMFYGLLCLVVSGHIIMPICAYRF